MSILLFYGNFSISVYFAKGCKYTNVYKFSTFFLLIFSYLLCSLLSFSHSFTLFFVFSFSLFPLCYLSLWSSDMYSFYNWNWVGLLPLFAFPLISRAHFCLTIFPLFFRLQPQKSSLVFWWVYGYNLVFI